MLAILELAFATLVASGCYLDMPLGEIDVDAGSDGADADADGDTDPIDVCLDWRPHECRVPLPDADHLAPPVEKIGAPVGASEPLHVDSWTFTALQSDVHGRLYAFFWWVPSSELEDPDLVVDHLAWRTRGAGESSWSEIRAVPGVTRQDFEEARCASPSDAPLQFTSTDDGYVHVFWRKNNSCRGGGVYYYEHAIFEDGDVAYRHNLLVECPTGRDLRMSDALGRPGGDVQVAFLCGPDAILQRFTCGCWGEPVSVDSDRDDEDVVLVEAGEAEPWLVVRDVFRDIQLRRPANAAIAISDEGSAVGSPTAFMDDGGRLWVAWQAVTTPSDGLRVTSLVDGAFEPELALTGGVLGSEVQAIDGVFVPGRGPVLLTEETFSPAAPPGKTTHEIDDLFYTRTFVDGAWSEPELAASNHATFEGTLARHTASDLEVAAGTPYLAYEVYVGGETPFELRVDEVPPREGP